MEIRNAAIIGLGAIGCTLYPGLIKALGEENVYVIAGGERGEKLRSKGININGQHYVLNVTAPDEEKIFDLIVFAVKYRALPAALEDVGSHVGEGTAIMSLMNGVSSEREIGERYGMEHMVYCVSSMNGKFADGRAEFTINEKGIAIGSGEGLNPERLQAVAELMKKSGLPFSVSPNILHEMWYKFALNVAGNTLSGILRANYGYFQSYPSLSAAMMMLMEEVRQISWKEGGNLSEDDLSRLCGFFKSFPPENMSSTLQDVLAKRRTENELFCGTVLKLGRRYSIPTPACELCYYLLQTVDAANQDGRGAYGF